VTNLQQLRAAIADRIKQSAGGSHASEISTAGQALDAALAPLAGGPAGFGIAHRDLGRRLNDMLVADMQPTPSVIAGVDGPCASIDAAIAELRQMQGKITAMNTMLTGAGLAALPAWTPPAAPACGAK
jgi:hypothetical protein